MKSYQLSVLRRVDGDNRLWAGAYVRRLGRAEGGTTQLPHSSDSARSHYSMLSFKQYAMILRHPAETSGASSTTESM